MWWGRAGIGGFPGDECVSVVPQGGAALGLVYDKEARDMGWAVLGWEASPVLNAGCGRAWRVYNIFYNT